MEISLVDFNNHFAAAAIQGQRERQEDVYKIYGTVGKTVLAVLADGMGGHPGGAEAAQVAVDAFVGAYKSAAAGASVAPPISMDMLQAANRAVAKEAENNKHLAGMGCTLVAALVRRDMLEWISIGDSLLYLFAGGRLQKLNADHSVDGALTSALMGRELGDVDHNTVAIPSDESLVVAATDGILTLDAREIEECVAAHRAGVSAVAHNLMAEIVSREDPYQDNAAVLVVAPTDA